MAEMTISIRTHALSDVAPNFSTMNVYQLTTEASSLAPSPAGASDIAIAGRRIVIPMGFPFVASDRTHAGKAEVMDTHRGGRLDIGRGQGWADPVLPRRHGAYQGT